MENLKKRIENLNYSDLLLLQKKLSEFLKEVNVEYENIRKLEEENS